MQPLPDYEPADTIAIEDGIGFQAVVSANGSRVVKYVVAIRDSDPKAALEAIQRAPGPRVRRVVSLD